MSTEWRKARPGYEYRLTGYGLEFSRIRVKFEKNYVNRKQYEKKVPVSWLENGYVTESKINEQNTDELDG